MPTFVMNLLLPVVGTLTEGGKEGNNFFAFGMFAFILNAYWSLSRQISILPTK